MPELAVTLDVDAEAQHRFDAERARWLPAGGPARVVLFHALPADLDDRVRADLVGVAGPPFPVSVAAPLPLRRGVALALYSPELTQRHARLRERWGALLSPRDDRVLRPHVVVQQDVAPVEVRLTLAGVRRTFRPFQARAEGYVLWRRDEPEWTELARIPFR